MVAGELGLSAWLTGGHPWPLWRWHYSAVCAFCGRFVRVRCALVGKKAMLEFSLECSMQESSIRILRVKQPLTVQKQLRSNTACR